jgi:hypothetical protein
MSWTLKERNRPNWGAPGRTGCPDPGGPNRTTGLANTNASRPAPLRRLNESTRRLPWPPKTDPPGATAGLGKSHTYRCLDAPPQ